MPDRIQVVAIAGSILLLLLVLELVRRRLLAEEYSALWIVSSLALIGISLRRDVLDYAAGWLGIHYPPVILVLVLVAIIAVATLSFSVILSRQQRQISRLIEESAIMAAELRELRWERERQGRGETSGRSALERSSAISATDVIADAAHRGADAGR